VFSGYYELDSGFYPALGGAEMQFFHPFRGIRGDFAGNFDSIEV
jgi:hypothetical protein